MKYISKIAMFAASLFMMAACETYGDPEVETTAVAPLDGRWICLAYNAADYAADPDAATPVEYVEIWTSNTTNNDSDKIWVNLSRPCKWAHGGYVYAYSVKADCNVKDKTMSITNGKTVEASPYFITTCYYYGAYSGYFYGTDCYSSADLNVTLSSNVTVNGVETASSTADKKYYTDKIVMNFKADADPAAYGSDAIDWVIVGSRWTGWAEDHQKETEWLNNFFGY